jgi:hypothetical protein
MAQKKGQSLSADILVVSVIVLFGVLFLVMNQINKTQEGDIYKKLEESEVETQIIYESLVLNSVVDEDNNLDIEEILSLNHDELRYELGLRNDFAIVFEKEGKLVMVDPQNNITCLGSPKVVVNGIACS